MDALHALSNDGLSVALMNGQVIVRPRERITQTHRMLIQQHKADIIRQLMAANDEPDTSLAGYHQALDRARVGLAVTLDELIEAGGDELRGDWQEPHLPHRSPEFLACFAMAVNNRLHGSST